MTTSANWRNPERAGPEQRGPEQRGPFSTLIATGIVVACAFFAFHDATLGMQVVSTEAGRRLEIARSPRVLPAARLDLPSQPDFAAWLRADGSVTIVAFIYTRCTSVCSVLGSEFQQLQAAIDRRGLRGKVRLVSVSFDPHDTRRQLAAYAQGQGADPAVWQLVGLASPAEIQAVLDAFGIVVVPAPLGEYVHNAAFHIVDRAGRLTQIVDFDNPERALAEAVAVGGRASP